MILNFTDYKAYLRGYVRTRPKKGRGILTQMAKHLSITSAQISHIFKGDRHLSAEQAISLSQFLGLNAVETDYFFELVSLARAGNNELRNFHLHKITKIKEQALKIQNHVVKDHRVLTEAEKAVFYSSWIYSAIRMYCSIKESTLDEISAFFQIRKNRLLPMMNFLCEADLCLKTDKGYRMGQHSTFLPRNSPFVLKHHANWRIKAIEKSEKDNEEDLFYTSPVSISKNDIGVFRLKVLDLIKDFSRLVKESKAENVACLNIDFFQIEKD